MVKYEYGNMWESWGKPWSLFLVTTNASIRRDGRLVMGRGIAKQLNDKDRAWARLLGARIEEVNKKHEDYGLAILTDHEIRKQLGTYKAFPHFSVGAFQVKRHYRDAAEPKLIELAVKQLRELCLSEPNLTVNLNYPGIGFGRLSEAVVAPLLKPLPPKVHVWRFEYQKARGRT